MRSRAALVDPWNDTAADKRSVSVPVLAVLSLALFFVTSLTVKEKNTKVDQEEISEDEAPAARFGCLHGLLFELARGRVDALEDHEPGDPSRQGVRPRHKPVAEVVDMTS